VKEGGIKVNIKSDMNIFSGVCSRGGLQNGRGVCKRRILLKNFSGNSDRCPTPIYLPSLVLYTYVYLCRVPTYLLLLLLLFLSCSLRLFLVGNSLSGFFFSRRYRTQDQDTGPTVLRIFDIPTCLE
jgi:hypothetical protein